MFYCTDKKYTRLFTLALISESNMTPLGLVTGCGWTRGIHVTGVTGTGMVLIFRTFGHTATHTCGVAGFHRYVHLYSVCSISLTIFIYFLSFISSLIGV